MIDTQHLAGAHQFCQPTCIIHLPNEIYAELWGIFHMSDSSEFSDTNIFFLYEEPPIERM